MRGPLDVYKRQSLEDLKPGDYVVHQNHGIGVYTLSLIHIFLLFCGFFRLWPPVFPALFPLADAFSPFCAVPAGSKYQLVLTDRPV